MFKITKKIARRQYTIRHMCAGAPFPRAHAAWVLACKRLRQQYLYFPPLQHGQISLRPAFGVSRRKGDCAFCAGLGTDGGFSTVAAEVAEAEAFGSLRVFRPQPGERGVKNGFRRRMVSAKRLGGKGIRIFSWIEPMASRQLRPKCLTPAKYHPR